jgi:hypothetical protein
MGIVCHAAPVSRKWGLFAMWWRRAACLRNTPGGRVADPSIGKQSRIVGLRAWHQVRRRLMTVMATDAVG